MDLDLADTVVRCADDTGQIRLTNQASRTSSSRPTRAALILAAGLIRMRFTADTLAGTIAVSAPLPTSRPTTAERYRHRTDSTIEHLCGHSSQRKHHQHGDRNLGRER